MADQATQGNTQADSKTDNNAQAGNQGASKETLLSGQGQGAQGNSNADASKEGDAAKSGQAQSGADGKSADQKSGDSKAADDKSKDGKAAEGAPEKYTDFKAPDGVVLDKELVGELSTVAKEFNLSQENAQKLADLGIKQAHKIKTQIEEANDQAWAAARTGWVSEIKADKEFGGAKLKESTEYAFRAKAKFGDPKLEELIDSGWGDHPALFRFLAKVGKALGEDKTVEGNQGGGQPTAAQVLYPNQGKQ